MGAVVRYLIARFGEVVMEWTLSEILRRLARDAPGGALPELEAEDVYFWDDEHPCDWEDPCN